MEIGIHENMTFCLRAIYVQYIINTCLTRLWKATHLRVWTGNEACSLFSIAGILHELVHAFPIFLEYHKLFRVVYRNPRNSLFPFLTVWRRSQTTGTD